MSKFIVTFVCLLSLLCARRIESKPSTTLEQRIANGYPAQEGQFPWQASIRPWSGHHCGGSIIDPEWILTAAHCIPYDARGMVVSVGSIYSEHGILYQVSQTNTHEDFKMDIELENNTLTYIENDIALIKVTPPIRLTSNIALVELEKGRIEGIVSCTASGWGYTTTSSNVSKVLQYVNLQTVTSQVCESDSLAHNTNICTSVQDYKAICNGDSGGPLVLGGTNKQIGINSVANQHCGFGTLNFYTRVSSYIEWIQTQIGKPLR